MAGDTATGSGERLHGEMPGWHRVVDDTGFRAVAQAVRAAGGRLIALWASDRRHDRQRFEVHAAFGDSDGLRWLTLPVDPARPDFPSVADLYPVANRMERAAFDLVGLRARGNDDRRRWLRHGAWPGDWHPLRKDAPIDHVGAGEPDEYAFVTVTGDGVHEIPVGPVHAGTIEPGHFRFSVVGERVLRLEERLGYKHKAIEKRVEGATLWDGAKIVSRVSGDSTVAYGWAYAAAAESALAIDVPARAAWLRALALERERIANHLGDLGALGNDAGLAFGLAQFSLLKEGVLRTHAGVFGHRYLMDFVVPGGVANEVTEQATAHMLAECDRIERGTQELRRIYDDHAGLQDRFMTTGEVTPDLAARLGLTGAAGRASGQAHDLRVAFRPRPYNALEPRMVTHRGGDVAARVAVRFDEVLESLRLCRHILRHLPAGPFVVPLPARARSPLGFGWIEGWRGDVLVALELDGEGCIERLHAHDPSWQNWPLIEHAIIGNIVPDFPLINKSFNLSYSGHDL